jgi:glucosamine--fructose-6-phosphate aminotransferase (isomerizing)
VRIYDQNHNVAERRIQVIDLDQNIIDKSGYDHYMLKEIFQQPQTIANCLNQYIDFENHSLKLPALSFDWKNIKKINIPTGNNIWHKTTTLPNMNKFSQ